MNLNKLISGRMNRAPFVGYFFLILAVRIALGWVVLMNFKTFMNSSVLLWTTNLIDVAISLVAVWALIKRLHDLNWPTILAFIPFIYALLGFDVLETEIPKLIFKWTMAALVICCLFMKGDKGPNKYGPDPLEKK